jgi:hypothetical protein
LFSGNYCSDFGTWVNARNSQGSNRISIELDRCFELICPIASKLEVRFEYILDKQTEKIRQWTAVHLFGWSEDNNLSLHKTNMILSVTQHLSVRWIFGYINHQIK